jgi:uroporphyrinogen-III decarboxylase
MHSDIELRNREGLSKNSVVMKMYREFMLPYKIRIIEAVQAFKYSSNNFFGQIMLVLVRVLG